jgi:hypothetical protein
MVALSIGAWGGTSSDNRDCWGGWCREDAWRSPLKQEAFGILDAIGGQDPRLNGWWLDSKNH